jgi:hypothetical protein
VFAGVADTGNSAEMSPAGIKISDEKVKNKFLKLKFIKWESLIFPEAEQKKKL